MARCLIFGTGSIGTVYAFLLHRAKAEVLCICRSNYTEAKAYGLTIDSSVWGAHTFKPSIVASVCEAAEFTRSNGPLDFVIVCTKSLQAPPGQPATWDLLKPVIGPDTTIVIIQNGLGVERDAQSVYPSNAIISGVAYLPTTRNGTTSVVHTEMERLHLGLYKPSPTTPEAHGAKLDQFATLIKAGGGTALVSADIQVERWKKIIANGTWNPICALSRCRDVEFLSTSTIAKDVVQGVMTEICVVAAACGYEKDVNKTTVAYQLSRTAAREWPGVQPSMMADMLADQRMEVDAVLAEILRLASEHKIICLRLETLFALLKGLDHAIGCRQERR